MARKGLLVLVIAIFAGGAAFAQTDFESMPKNTVTVDFGPTLLAAAFGAMVKSIKEDDLSINSSGFGIAAQFERQTSQQISVAGRFAYMGIGLDVLDTGFVFTRAEFNLDLASLSAEGHVRYYPFGETFFLNGMLGYGNLQLALNGEILEDGKRESIDDFNTTRHYVKYGGKLGWRIDFGKPGGLTFEPSLGYYGKIGLGDTLTERLNRQTKEDFSNLDEYLKLLENVIFIGGPRVSLALGWRF
jgi:hypothetical protein